MTNSEKEIKESPRIITFSEFLENVPPSYFTDISNLTYEDSVFDGSLIYYLNTPEIQLHCSGDNCNGTRFFRCTDRNKIKITEEFSLIYLSYICSNCRRNEKIFSLSARYKKGLTLGECYKFGELPPYGSPISPKLIKLIGPDHKIFLKGRNCEKQGLGIGAFVYYRRVVENQKNRIIDEIIKVSEKLSASESHIAILKKARKETQFSKALALVKDAIPQVLLIDGHNPLTLLHSALSEGLHGQTDEDCLEVANNVRIILAELSDRLGQALKDEAGLKRALSKLSQKNSASK